MTTSSILSVGQASTSSYGDSDYSVIKRDGSLVTFNAVKIENALLGAFLEVLGPAVGSAESTRQKIIALTQDVMRTLLQRRQSGGTMTLHIEEIQDVVEAVLMRSNEPKVARAYVLYRDKRAKERAQVDGEAGKREVKTVIDDEGRHIPLPRREISEMVVAACHGFAEVEPKKVLENALHELYENIPMREVRTATVLAARAMIEEDPSYKFVTARLLLSNIRNEIVGKPYSNKEMPKIYPISFIEFIGKGIAAELLDPELAKFDLERLGAALHADRDLDFDYLGLQTLYDRYFLHIGKRRIEMPQHFFMRVAMGLALNEADRETRAIEFYEVFSTFDFLSSTPTLFNSATLHSQMSSCYLTTVPDDLAGIYDAIKENALLSKFAGGLGNDWTSVRAMGAHIKGTNGESQGVVPFLKVVNDTAVAVNQGGKRKGAVCAYLETWHLDIEEFLDLRKNTGDDRRRTHDMNTANWVPDLFMRRVVEGGTWTLFSPSSVPDIHDKFGSAFETAYVAYEAAASQGHIKPSKTVQAKDLWRKMLTMLFETGHPWITFKDACNLRSPQQHVGVVHSSNLCTEITLNTSDTETAVCNLGSVNLLNHLKQDGDGKVVLDHEKLKITVAVGMRMLDNVIDRNFYPVEKARVSNMRHRPVGLGIMGFQDALNRMKISYASQEAVEFADTSMEAVCYYAFLASSDMAVERGKYESYEGSLWSQGILPLDTLDMLSKERGGHVEVDRSMTMDWAALRSKILRDGMRNSNCVAIAPTATISNIVGVDASIEPSFSNLSVKSNLSGEFTVLNAFMVRDLKEIGLWDKAMVADLKHFDGSLSKIARVPERIKDLYKTAFEIDALWLIEAASRRQKWIDQAQSLNIYMAGASGKKLDSTYKLAWVRGLKTTYYLRTQSATNAEKSTGTGGELNAVR